MKRTRQNQAKGSAKSKSRRASRKESGDNDAKQQNDKSVCREDGAQTSNESVREKTDNERPGSPDPNCPICLCKMDDKAFTNSCFHMFCFTCLLEWSKVKAVCPLCKQSFKSIIHNIRSESDYDIYSLRENMAAAAAADADDILPPDLTMFEYDRRSAYPWHNVVMPFEYLPQLFNTTPPIWLRFQGEVLSEFDQRRRVYHTSSRVQEIQLPDGTSYRDISPEYFAANLEGDHVHQISVWLSRELGVLFPIQSQLYLKRLIMNLITRFPIQSEDFYECLHQHFGDRTRIFINELYNFARSPLSITDTDRLTVYDTSTPTGVEVITLDRDDSDIEIISPPANGAVSHLRNSLLDSPRSDSPDNAGRSSPSVARGIAFESVEDENRNGGSPVPGPSGFLQHRDLLQSSGDGILCSSPEPLVEEIFDNESSSTSIYDNEIMFVGFDRPWRSRSPISLSSDDSDIDVDDVSLAVSSKASPVSEELLELNLQHGSCNARADNTKKFSNEEDCSSSSTWSNLESGELYGSPEVKRPRCSYKSSPSLNRNHCENEPDFKYNCDCENRKNDTFQECFCHCGFRADHPSSMQNGDLRDPSCQGRDGDHQFWKKRLKSRTECQRSLKRRPRKRRRDDCGDSGVAVDVKRCVEDVSDSSKVTYKKHCRGHKKSSHVLEKGSHVTEVRDDATTLALDGRDFDADNIAAGSKRASDCEVANRDDQMTDPNDENEGEEILGGAKRGSVSSKSLVSNEFGDPCTSSVSTTFSEKDSVSSNQCTSFDLHSRNAVPSGDSATCDTLPTQPVTASSNLDGLDAVSPRSENHIESIDIDSEDSVQWLDLEKPNSETEERLCRGSVVSNGSVLCSDALNSDILQVSDDEENEGNSCDNSHTPVSNDDTEIGPVSVQIAGSPAIMSRHFEDSTEVNRKETAENSLQNVCDNVEMGKVDNPRLPSVLKSSLAKLDGMNCEASNGEFDIRRISNEIDFDKLTVTNYVKNDVNTIQKLDETSERDEKLSDAILQEGSSSDFSGGNFESPENKEMNFHQPVINEFLNFSDTNISSSLQSTSNTNSPELQLELPAESLLIQK